jgi:Tfp pilus assembly protein PilF
VMVHRGLLPQAGAAAKEAVALEPDLPAAHTELGYFYYRSGNFVAADEEMTKAIRLGSNDFLAFYCHGVLLLRDLSADEELTQQARAALEQAARLNPLYPPTFEALTQTYSRTAETQGKALEAARTAVGLDPNERTYQFGLAYVLLNNGRVAEAGEVASKLAASASSPQETRAAHSLLGTVEEEREWQKESAEQGGSDVGNGESVAKADVMAAADGVSGRPASSRRQLGPPAWVAVDGVIAAIDCGHSPEVTLTLHLAKGPLSFHVRDLRRIGVSGVSEQTTPALETCKDWAGRPVKIWLRLVPDKDYFGEITKIYFY